MRNLSSRNSIFSSNSRLITTAKLYQYRPIVNQLAKYQTFDGDYIGEEQYDDGNGPVLAHDSVVTGNGKIIRVVSEAALYGTGTHISTTVYDALSPGNWNQDYWATLSPAPKNNFRPSLAIANDGLTIYLGYVNTSGTVTIKKSTNYGASWSAHSTLSMPSTIAGTYGAASITQAGCTSSVVGQVMVLSYEEPYLKIYKYGWATIHNIAKSDAFYPRYAQWFDVEALNNGYLQYIFVGQNGSTNAATYKTGIYSDPIPLIGIDPDYPDHQCLASAITLYGSRLYVNIIRRIASSLGRFYEAETLLGWSTDGLSYSMPENGRISNDMTRGKIQIYDDKFYSVSQSNVYTGDFVKSLGNTSAESISATATSVSLSASSGEKPEMSAKVNYQGVIYPRSQVEIYTDSAALLIEGSNQLYSTSIVDRITVAADAAKIESTLLARGMLGVLSNYYSPISDVIDGKDSWHQSLRKDDAGNIPFKGNWRFQESSYQWYKPRNNENALGVSLSPISVRENWTANVRLGPKNYAVGAGLAFFIEMDEDTGSYKDDFLAALVFNTGTTRIDLVRVKEGIITVLKTFTPSISYTAGLMHSLCVSRTVEGIHIAFKQSVTGSWSHHHVYFDELDDFKEPLKSMIGMAVRPRSTLLTRAISSEDGDKVYVQSTSLFPSAGYIKINNEIIEYNNKTSTYFRIRRRGALATSSATHAIDDTAYISDDYVMFRGLHIYEIGYNPTVAEMIQRIITRAGLEAETVSIIDWDSLDGMPSTVWRQTNGQTVSGGVVEMDDFMLTTAYGASFVGSITGHIRKNGIRSELGFVLWASDPDVPANCSKIEIVYSFLNDVGEIRTSINGDLFAVAPWNWLYHPFSDGEEATDVRRFNIIADNERIMFFIDGRMAAEYPLSLTYSPTGYFGVVGANSDLVSMNIPEIFDPAPFFAWDTEDSASQAIKKLTDGREIFLKENPDGSVKISQFRTGRDNLGTWSNNLVVQSTKQPEERYWIGGVTVWGRDSWAPMADKSAQGTRWVTIEAPYLGTEEDCRREAAYRIALAKGQSEKRSVIGMLDVNAEPFDEVYLEGYIGQLPAGTYVIESIKTSIDIDKWAMSVSLRLKEPITEKSIYNTMIWGDTINNTLWGSSSYVWW